MKLYRVHCEIKYDVFCLAESPKAATEACIDGYAEEELRVHSFYSILSAFPAYEVTELSQIPEEWRGALVYHPEEHDIKIEDALPSRPESE